MRQQVCDGRGDLFSPVTLIQRTLSGDSLTTVGSSGGVTQGYDLLCAKKGGTLAMTRIGLREGSKSEDVHESVQFVLMRVPSGDGKDFEDGGHASLGVKHCRIDMA